MLALSFHIGNDRYVVDSRDVVEVLPLVELHRVGHRPDWMAGLFTYRGAVTPVIDLYRLLSSTGAACPNRLSSRIILVRYPVGRTTRWLGFLAERISVESGMPESEGAGTGPAVVGAAALGPILADEKGMVQVVEIARLLPAELRDQLFTDLTEVG